MMLCTVLNAIADFRFSALHVNASSAYMVVRVCKFYRNVSTKWNNPKLFEMKILPRNVKTRIVRFTLFLKFTNTKWFSVPPDTRS